MLKNIKLKGLVLLSLSSFLIVGCSSDKEEPKKEETKTEEVIKEKEIVLKKPEELSVSKVSEEEKETDYLFFMLTKNSELNDYFSEFSKLFGGEIVLDEEFMYDIALNVAGIQKVANEIIDYRGVPTKFKEVHLYYSESMGYYIEAMNDVVLAVGSNFEDNHMTNAMKNLQLGGDYLEEATKLTEEIKNNQR